MLTFRLASSVLLFASAAQAATECQKWFARANLKPGPKCAASCAALPTDMSTFTCTTFCEKYCTTTADKIANAGKAAKRRALAALADLYPGLTDEEQKLAEADPEKALQAYILSHRAENLCRKIYPASAVNDESDACRHFVWASLLQNDFGTKYAEKVLAAHEADPLQPKSEKAMDKANNEVGLLSSRNLISQKRFSEGNVVAEFKRSLAAGSLTVIRRRYPKETEIRP